MSIFSGNKCEECGHIKHPRIWTWLTILGVCFIVVFVFCVFFKTGSTVEFLTLTLEVPFRGDIKLFIENTNTTNITRECLDEPDPRGTIRIHPTYCKVQALNEYIYMKDPENMVCRHRSYILQKLLEKEGIQSNLFTTFYWLSVEDYNLASGHMVLWTRIDDLNTSIICDPMQSEKCMESWMYFANLF